jgi:ATP-dependent Clp protease adaptor protein ClpS
MIAPPCWRAACTPEQDRATEQAPNSACHSAGIRIRRIQVLRATHGLRLQSASMATTVETPPQVHREARPTPRRQPPYHVVLLDDDDHTYQYVIHMLQILFGHPPERGMQMAREVDATGRVIVCTTTLEHAELKRDQIHSFGPDRLLRRSCGAMSAVLEPA